MGMGMGGGRLSRFCLNRIATRARTPNEARPIAGGPRSSNAGGAPPLQSNHVHAHSSDRSGDGSQTDHGHDDDGESWAKFEGNSASRKIMVVVDSSPEAKRALLWTLSHTLQDHDTLILLHVVRVSKPPQPGNNSPPHKDAEEFKDQIDAKNYQVPNSLKALCKSRRPEVEVEVIVVEGKDKGPAIVSQARKHAVSLLILGQRKPSLLWRLLITWAGGKIAEGAGGGVVEYCIQNADCMTLAVRRKSRRSGGYLITTKRQKNFWLLA